VHYLIGGDSSRFILMRFNELMPILQAAVSPVILISGVGLLILSMTNRLGRVVDRSRQLGDALRGKPQQERDRLEPQLRILFKRARLLRAAISLATLSVLLAAILVIALFLTAFLRVELVVLSAALFIGCLLSLIVSLLAFLQDINLSLSALKLELERNEDVIK
jgi:hypothetical protein